MTKFLALWLQLNEEKESHEVKIKKEISLKYIHVL